MKKIVFVEKQDHAFDDPVTTFFANRKSASTTKPNTTSKLQSKTPLQKKYYQKQLAQKNKRLQKPIQTNIGRKGQQIPKNTKVNFNTIKKQENETIYLMNHKSNEHNLKNSNEKNNANYYHKYQAPQQQQIPQYIEEKQQSLPLIKQKSNQIKVNQLKKRIKELQISQTQYLRKLADYEQKQQKFYKTQQKLNKLQKDQKLSSTQNKQIIQKMKDLQDQNKKLLSKDDIKYSKKRQVLLTNQINKIKKCNRQLVSRIKNYKGTDLMQLSIAKNKTEILNQCDDVQHEQVERDFGHLQTLCYRMLSQSQQYLNAKTNAKGIQWISEQKYLLQIIHLNQKISQECLKHQFKIPSCNQQTKGVYNEIQQYRKILQPLIDHNDLTFAISEQNIAIINELEESISQQFDLIKADIFVQSPKKNTTSKNTHIREQYTQKFKRYINIYNQKNRYQLNILSQAICEKVFIKQWTNDKLKILGSQIHRINQKLKQLSEIFSVGGNTIKESLFIWVQSNLKQLNIKTPEMQLKIKNLIGVFKKLQNSNKLIK